MRGTFTRLGVLGCVVVGLLVPAGAEATSPALTVPDPPVNVAAVVSCSDVIGPGGNPCALSVTWSAGAHDGGSPVLSFTVVGDRSSEPTILHVSGEAAATYQVSWAGSAGPTGGSDKAFSVTATNSVGTSTPTTAEVQLQCFCPPLQPKLWVTTKDNGRRDDVLTLGFRGAERAKATVRVNGKPHTVRVRNHAATLTVRDKNRRRPTIYTVKYEDVVQRVVAS